MKEEIFKSYPCGFVSLAIMREFYLDYVRDNTYDGKYRGEISVINHINGLDQVLRGIEYGRRKENQ